MSKKVREIIRGYLPRNRNHLLLMSEPKILYWLCLRYITWQSCDDYMILTCHMTITWWLHDTHMLMGLLLYVHTSAGSDLWTLHSYEFLICVSLQMPPIVFWTCLADCSRETIPVHLFLWLWQSILPEHHSRWLVFGVILWEQTLSIFPLLMAPIPTRRLAITKTLNCEKGVNLSRDVYIYHVGAIKHHIWSTLRN